MVRVAAEDKKTNTFYTMCSRGKHIVHIGEFPSPIFPRTTFRLRDANAMHLIKK